MKHLIYSPQPNTTPDEAMTGKDYVMDEYEKLPTEAKRHFKIIEE